MWTKISEVLFRLTIGSVFIESGIGKWKDMPQVVSYFESLKIPMANIQAPMVACIELICGLAILVGFKTRWAAVPLMGTMVVALITAKADEITGFSSLTGLTEFLYLIILFHLFAQGSRFLSFDRRQA